MVVCEGRVTEPQYLKEYNRFHRDSVLDIEISKVCGVPKTLVDHAKERKSEATAAAKTERDKYLAYDSVWCVFDIDEHPNLPHAIQMANDNGIELAISNPCFELWLLLHFRESPGMQHRDRITKLLTSHVQGYDKSIDYAVYSSGLQDAELRAARLGRAAEEAGDPIRNPTTGVYRLTATMRGIDPQSLTEPARKSAQRRVRKIRD